MKILLRRWDEEEYIWKDATYKDGRFNVDNRDVYETNIVSVLEDNRSEFIRCSVCGKSFKKGSKEWQEHITPVTDTSKCFECTYLRNTNINLLSSNYSKNDDGSYTKTQKTKVKLCCGVHYYDIDNPKAREYCIYNRCKNANPNSFSDFFTEHPGAFDDIITVDKILKFGYKSRSQNYTEFRYQLKAKNQIEACVNNLNIVDHFKICYRNYSWEVYYSKKYNKIYYNNGNKYEEWSPYRIPETTKNYILAKIAALYS